MANEMEHIPLNGIDDSVATSEGLSSADELRGMLLKRYPDIGFGETVATIRFSLVDNF